MSSFAGALTVNAGTLTVDGSLTAAALTMNNGTLRGSGTVEGFAANDGTVAPGTTSTLGALRSSGNATLSSNAVLDVDITSGGADQLVIFGTVNLGGAALAVNSAVLSGGEAFIIIDNDGSDAVTGTFNGLPEGALLTNGVTVLRITYAGGDGNDVMLVNTASPAGGAVRIWDGGGTNGFWNHAGNWSNNILPQTGDIIVFPPGAARQINTNNFPTDTPFNIVFAGTNYTLRGQTRIGMESLLMTNANGTNRIEATVKLTETNGPVRIEIIGSRTVDTTAATMVVPVDTPVLKLGSGTLLLGAGASINWQGPLTISNGFMNFTALGPLFPVTIGGNGTITGDGGCGPLTVLSGSVRPGENNQSSLKVGGDALLHGGNFQITISSAIAGSGYPQLIVTGAVDIAGAVLAPALTFSPTVGTEFVLIRKEGTNLITGQFSALPEGSMMTLGATTLAVTHHGGDGNDFALRVVTTPINGAKVWDGGGGNNFWNTGLNWVGDGVPFTGEGLEFAGAARTLNTNNFAAGTGFNFLRFSSASAFTLRGNAISLLNGITNATASSNVVDLPITMENFQTIAVNSGGLTLNGAIEVDASIALTKTGAGQLTLAGSSANTISGPLRVNRGTLRLAKTGGANAFSDIVEIGGSGFPATLQIGANNQLNTHSVVLRDSQSSLVFAGAAQDTALSIDMTGSSINTSTGRLDLAFNLTTRASASPAVIDGLLNVTGFSTFVVENGAAADDLLILAATDNFIVAGITKRGAGRMVMAGSNNVNHPFLGFDVEEGIVTLRSPNALNGQPAVHGGATIELEGNHDFTQLNTEFLLLGDSTNAPGGSPATLATLSGSNVMDLHVQGAVVLRVETNSTVYVRWSEEGNIPLQRLTKTGPGALRLGFLDTTNFHTFVMSNGLVDLNEAPSTAVTMYGGRLVAPYRMHSLTVTNGTVEVINYPGFGFPWAVSNAVTLGNGAVFETTLTRPMTAGGAIRLGGSTLRVLTSTNSPFNPHFAEGATIVLISNMLGAPVTGTFSGLPEGAMFTNAPFVLQISYQGPNNSVVLRVVNLISSGITRVWTGADPFASPFWNSPTNWQGNQAPREGDALVFPVNASRRNSTNGFALFVSSITIQTNYILGGANVQLSDGIHSMGTGNPIVALPLTLAGPVALGTNDLTIESKGTSTISFSNRISGSGAIRIAGGFGSARFVASNDFTGPISVADGSLRISHPSALGSVSAGTSVDPFKQLIFEVPLTVAEPISCAGEILATMVATNRLLGPLTLTGSNVFMGGQGSDGSWQYNGTISGSGLASFYLGRNEFNGPNSYAGTFRTQPGVSQFTHLIMNSAAPGVHCVVNDAGIMGGTGLVASVDAGSGGEINPGQSTGILRVSGDVNLAPTGRLTVELNSPTPGSGHDQLVVTGAVHLISSNGPSNVELVIIPGTTLSVGQTFTIVSNIGNDPINGIFVGQFQRPLPQDSFITNSPYVFRISYVAGDGNDIALTVTSVIVPTGITRVWDGGATPNHLWTNAVNWNPDAVPQSGDDLVFPSSVASNRRVMTNNFPTGMTFNQLFFGGASTWTLRGNPVAVLSGLTVTNIAVPVDLRLPVELAADGTFLVSNASLSISDGGELRLNNRTLTLNDPGGAFISGRITGSGALVKVGAGVLMLAGSNTFTGGFLISNGLVNVLAPNAPGTPWVVRGGATLRLSPGAAVPGIVVSNGAIGLASGFIFGGGVAVPVQGDLHLSSGATVSNAVLQNWLTVAGAVRLNESTLVPNSFFSAVPGAEIMHIQNDGADAVIGTYAGMPEGTVFAANQWFLRISYVGGDGNDVTFTIVAPPATHLTRLWSGGGTDDDWSTPANWTGNEVPAMGDDIVFPVIANRRSNTNDMSAFPSNYVANSLLFQGSNYTINGGISVSTGAVMAAVSATNTIVGDVFLYGDQIWSVANAAATLRLTDGQTNGPIAGMFGNFPFTKTGAGVLELDNYVFANSNLATVAEGTLRLHRVSSRGPMQLLEGILDAETVLFEDVFQDGGTLLIKGAVITNLFATSGTLRISTNKVTDGIPSGCLVASNAIFDSNLVYQPVFHPVPPPAFASAGVTSNIPLGVNSGVLDLNGAQLAPQFTFPVTASNVFVAALHSHTNGIVGTFSGLPDGSVTQFVGRPFRINYRILVDSFFGFQDQAVTLTALPISPQFTNIVVQMNGHVNLQGAAEPNGNVIIDATEDFVQWTVIGNTPANASGGFQFADTQAPVHTQRFYRGRMP